MFFFSLDPPDFLCPAPTNFSRAVTIRELIAFQTSPTSFQAAVAISSKRIPTPSFLTAGSPSFGSGRFAGLFPPRTMPVRILPQCCRALFLFSCHFLVQNVLNLNLQVQGKFTVSVIWTTPHDTQRQLSAFATMSYGQGVSRLHQRGGS